MNATDTVEDLIRVAVTKRLDASSLSDDTDFFDVGATSLTIIDLQISIEKQLQRTVPTHELMANPTVADWARLYSPSGANS